MYKYFTSYICDGADDGLILNGSDHILEASFSNVFLSSNNILKIPRSEEGLLNVITRNIVIGLAVQCGMEQHHC